MSVGITGALNAPQGFVSPLPTVRSFRENDEKLDTAIQLLSLGGTLGFSSNTTEALNCESGPIKKPRKLQRKWTIEENNLLVRLMGHIPKDQSLRWDKLASRFPDRTGQDVRDHWRKVLFPPIQKSIERRYSIFFKSYESAVSRFHSIALPPLHSYQVEASLFMQGVKATYNALEKNSLNTEEFNFAEEECKRRTLIYNTLFEHYCTYVIDQKTYEIFLAERNNFFDLYIKLVSGKIEQAKFVEEVIFKEKEHFFSKFSPLFTQRYNQLNVYSVAFSPRYGELLQEISIEASNQTKLILEKGGGKDWKEAIMSKREVMLQLKGIVDRMEEIEDFINKSWQRILCEDIETIVIARLKNEMSAQEFSIVCQMVIQGRAKLQFKSLRENFLNILKEDSSQLLTLGEIEEKLKNASINNNPGMLKKLNDLLFQIRKVAEVLPKNSKF